MKYRTTEAVLTASVFCSDHWVKCGNLPMQVADLSRNVTIAPPVAVPDKIFGQTHFLDFIDRCHSLQSLHLPQAALLSLPHGRYDR